MSNFRRFISLTSAEQRRFLRAFCIVAGVRIGLSVIRFPRFQALLSRITASPRDKRTVAPTTAQLAREVRIASCYVPRATCLTQALAGQVFLAHYGYPTIVHVGVTKPEGEVKGFEAHAWLESDGKVVIGESEQPYVPLATLGETAGT